MGYFHMKTNKINELVNEGFKVNKTPDLQTEVTHANPFVIHGDNGVYKAHLKEGQYCITFASMCSNGATPFMIEQTDYPLLNDVQARIDEQARIEKEETEQLEEAVGPRVQKTLFGDLKEGDSFSKDENMTFSYRKTGEHSYQKQSQLVEGFDMIGKSEMEVFVEMFDTALTSEQKADIVRHMQPGLNRDMFDEELGMAIENIPGMEMMDEQELMALHDELFAMYQHMHQS